MFFSLAPLSPEFYLDPGSGSILFQMLIAAFLGAGILIRSQWSRIKRWFGVKPENVDETEDNNEENSGN
jgi:hypothetical protein